MVRPTTRQRKHYCPTLPAAQTTASLISAAALLANAVMAGCSDSASGGPSDAAGGGSDAAGASCQVERQVPPDEGARHTPECTPVSYNSKPPSSGTHYDTWPVFRAYDKPVPWGFLVHALEHGAVVIAYNCPEGCPDEVAAAKEVMAAVPPRPQCPRPPVIITPDPTLDVKFAASAWGHVLRAPVSIARRSRRSLWSAPTRGTSTSPTTAAPLIAKPTDGARADQKRQG